MELLNIFQYHSNWNIILLTIIGCSIAGVAIFIERILTLKRSEIDTNQFLLSLRSYIQKGNFVEAIQFCEKTGGALGNVIQAGLVRNHKSKDQVENAMEIRGLLEIAQLEKNAKILSIIAYITPLIGLLGTVLGFIQAFSEMRMSGLVDISATKIGEAMEYALVTTAAGLAVAIPSVLAYNYIVSRIESFVLEIQTTASEVVEILFQDPHAPPYSS